MDSDFLKQSHKKKGPPSRLKKILKRAGLFFSLIVTVLFFATWLGGVVFSKPIEDEGWYRKESHTGFFGTLRNLILQDDKRLEGIKADRINMLFLGMGGAGHDGAYLTDTIILASIKPSTNQIALISIPRDMSIPIPGYGWRKINHANAFGELKNPGEGADFAVKVIEQITQQPIHYFVRMDFAGFEQLVDQVGGVDVFVDRTFTDYQFPTYDHRYQVVEFEQGAQHLDGEQALQYARSRHGNNGEGSDFARSRRQQKVIVAFKNKLLSISTLFNPVRLNNLRKTLQSHVTTNVDINTGLQIMRIAKALDTNNIISLGLSNAPDGLLTSGTGSNLYMLLPRDRTFRQIQTTIANIFDTKKGSGLTTLSDATIVAPDEEDEIEKIIPEGTARIEVQNGTWVVGLAAKVEADLEKQEYYVDTITNADNRPYSTSMIFDLSNGKQLDTVKSLSEVLDMPIAGTVEDILQNSTLPEDPSLLSSTLPTEAKDDTDILIILGKDYTERN